MGYYIRVLSPNFEPVALSIVQKALADAGLKVTLSGDTGRDQWDQLIVAHPAGKQICAIERNDVAEGGLGREEIDEFADEFEDAQPKSAVNWLASYFPTVRSIYAIQILGGAYEGNGWDVVGCIQGAIWTAAGGIIQADKEGFSNEDGYHILWQFDHSVDGPWSMAVLENGKWRRFSMDLGNPDHRSTFLRGEVPAGVDVSG